MAEYLALIEGLTAVSVWAPDRVEVYLDSKLVVEQVRGNYRVKNAALAPLHTRALELISALPEVEIRHVERERNRGADALANRAIDEWKGNGADRQQTVK